MPYYGINFKKLVIFSIIFSLIFTPTFYFVYKTTGEKITLQLYFKELKSDNTGFMDSEKPTKTEDSVVNLDEVDGVMWIYENEKPLKIDGKVTVTLYFKSNIIARREVTVSLYDYTTSSQLGSKSQKVISTLLGSSATFTFTVKGYELSKKSGLALVVTSNKTGLLGKINFLKFNLLFNSNKHPSNLKISGVEELKSPPPFIITVLKGGNTVQKDTLKPGGIGEYKVEILNVGEKSDNVTLSYDFTPQTGWSAFFYSQRLYLPLNDYNSTNLTINAPTIETNTTLIIRAVGSTGSASTNISLGTSKRLYTYDMEIIKPKDGEAESGENITYTFIIKNIGDDIDTYNISASSQHRWDTWLEKNQTTLEAGKDDKIRVRVSIPKDAKVGTTDILTLKITYDPYRNLEKTVDVKTQVISPGIGEILFNSLKSISSSIGLTAIMGDIAPFVFLLILVIIILLVIFAILYFIKKKYVEIICVDRIKEVKPGDKAEYSLTILNPYKIRLLYNLSATSSQKPNWKISLSESEVILNPNESKEIKMTVETDELDNIGDWSEIKVKATPRERPSKAVEISLLVTLREGRPNLLIRDVRHFPKIFKSGDIVTTSLVVENNGDAPASGVSAILYVNGEERNKVENLIIPEGGFAKIKLPWIGVKGKNTIHIAVRQK
ncbi:MAG TPA: hypothetical protein ENG38_01450 [Thermoplasmatales archaeon]|nr:hypothetical protein [Thermoplasmatales archaeon]HEX08458.1 hypothetical protein [Thermoplasmatales archaeon]